MKREALIVALIDQGFYHGSTPRIEEESFDCTSYAFVRLAWERWMQSLPSELTESRGEGDLRPRGIPGVFDSNSHAHCFTAHLVAAFALDSVHSGQLRVNPAIGFFSFGPDDHPMSRHAAVWFCDHLKMIQVFDPGTGSARQLSADEKLTIDSLRLIQPA